MYSFSLLVNSNNIESVIEHLKHIFTVFGSPRVNEAIKKSLTYINDQLAQMNSSGVSMTLHTHEEVNTVNSDDDESIFDTDSSSANEEEVIINTTKAPFLPYISKRLSKSVLVCNDETQPDNDYYQPRFREVIEDKWIGIWSGIMYG